MSNLNEKQESGSLKREDSMEKGIEHVVQTDSKYHFDASDLDRVQRRLKQRHVQMYEPLFSSLLLTTHAAYTGLL
jgi:amino acid permease